MCLRKDGRFYFSPWIWSSWNRRTWPSFALYSLFWVFILRMHADNSHRSIRRTKCSVYFSQWNSVLPTQMAKKAKLVKQFFSFSRNSATRVSRQVRQWRTYRPRAVHTEFMTSALTIQRWWWRHWVTSKPILCEHFLRCTISFTLFVR